MAVVLVSDSNFFYRSSHGRSVFDLVGDGTTDVAYYGIWERKLCKVDRNLEDMFRFIRSLGAHDAMVILCLGQHDVIDAKPVRLARAVSKIVLLVEKYQHKLVVVELFDHSHFSASKEGYATGVSTLNLLWKHEALTDVAIEVLSTSFIRDHLFIQDLMHLNSEGMAILASVLKTKINAFCLPKRCLS